MTIQQKSRPVRPPATDTFAQPDLLRPLEPARRRAEEVVERIAAKIASGRLSAGARLPTEQEMMVAMGVSRTVVREAISALRARGLVVTRQGAGAFVESGISKQPYVIDPDGLGSLSGVIEILELRTAVEMEAAAMASERANGAQVKAIARASSNFTRAIMNGERAIKEDFDFHRSIAAATQNTRFVDFLDFLGGLSIPRQSIRAFEGAGGLQRYLKKIEKEHRAIFMAIKAGAPQRAREAMREHLINSQERYRQLAGALSKERP